MKVWKDYSLPDLVGAGKNAGWIAVMIVICVTTFAVSSVLLKLGSTAK